MFNHIIFSDKITLYWTKDEFARDAISYEICVNGSYHGKTDKTHYTISDLLPFNTYTIGVSVFNKCGCVCTRSFSFSTMQEKRTICVTEAPYFAIGDGKTLNTKAIQKAINDCGKNDRVYIPEGVFLTGGLELHSDMELYIAKGGVLQGTANPTDYLPMKKSRFEGIEGICYRSLLNIGELDNKGGCTTRNVVIRGEGEIYGGGRELLIATMDLAKCVFRPDTGPINDEEAKVWRSRGRLIETNNAENIVISGLTLGKSSAWNLHFIYSRNITTYDCKIVSQNVNNGDGWDPDSSENCVIFDCVFDTGDDCIAIKSGKNPEGNVINRPCKNTYIFDCSSLGGHGMSIGSEISGGVEGVYIWDCNFDNTWYGIQVKGTRKRGGYVKNLLVSDCTTTCIMIWSVGYNDDGEGSLVPPSFTDYIFKNLTVTGTAHFSRNNPKYRRFVYLCGFEEEEYYIKNTKFENITLVNVGENVPLETEYVSALEWKEIKIYK